MPRSTTTIAAAFATERDAMRATALVATVIEARVSYQLRRVLGEDGTVQMVVLEVSFADPALASRMDTIMRGAHGVPITVGALDLAVAAAS